MNLRRQAWAPMRGRESPLNQQGVFSCTQQSPNAWRSRLHPGICAPVTLSPFLQIRPFCPLVKLGVWACCSLPMVPGLSSQEPFCDRPMASSPSQKTIWPCQDSYRGSLAGPNATFASFCRGDWVGEPGATLRSSPFQPSHQQSSLPHVLPSHSAPHPTASFSPEIKLFQNVAVGWTVSHQMYMSKS